jgi:mono/diheme cytochrome c family protein
MIIMQNTDVNTPAVISFGAGYGTGADIRFSSLTATGGILGTGGNNVLIANDQTGQARRIAVTLNGNYNFQNDVIGQILAASPNVEAWFGADAGNGVFTGTKLTPSGGAVRAYRFEWPVMDVALAIGGMRLLMGVLVVGGIAWALSGVMTRLAASPARGSTLLMAVCAGTLLTALGALAPACVAAQSTAPPPARARSTMSGVYTADQAAKGKEVFAGACSGCHTVASHSGDLFAAKWMGRPLADFYDYVSNLMPKSAPATLTEDEYVWVTAYVLKLNGMPASTRELSAEPALLKSIRIESTQASAGGRSSTRERQQGARIR